MFETIFLFSLAFLWILFATIQDIRTKEIANWLNFSLAIFALGFRLFYSLFSAGNLDFFYQGLIGLAIFFVVGNLFYYGKLFAGGDAKLLISLGAVIPISVSFASTLQLLFFFLVIFLVSGAVYGIVVSAVLCIKNYGRFKREFRRQIKSSKGMIYLFLASAAVLLVLGYYVDSLFFFLAILTFFSAYFYPYAKAVDEAAMVRLIPVTALTEGDWLYENVRVGRKVIKTSWGGLTHEDLMSLRRMKSKKVRIRQGIAFTPVFLISFLVFVCLVSAGLWYPLW